MIARNVHLWLGEYLRQSSRRRAPFPEPTHVFFCFVDHFEPLWHGATKQEGVKRVGRWLKQYPQLAEQFRDADGRPPQHSFFFPAEEYHKEFLDQLSTLCGSGFGEVEIHLHHDNDTAENLARGLEQFKATLRGHGFLPTDREGRVRYGFIHGNWCLDNSRGDRRWCGVNNELQVLRDTGCYADFTMPSAPSDTQTSKVNSIYYATDDPHLPKSHNTGVDAKVGRGGYGDLLLVQGPLALNWSHRKWGLLPRIENADISGAARPTPDRVRNWVRQRIGVAGKPDWVFVKVHTHGCQEHNFEAAIGESAKRMHDTLQQEFNDGKRFCLHYVTAREVYNLIKAAETGASGPPVALRDFSLTPPHAVGDRHSVTSIARGDQGAPV